jgi:hypothetical protein
MSNAEWHLSSVIASQYFRIREHIQHFLFVEIMQSSNGNLRSEVAPSKVSIASILQFIIIFHETAALENYFIMKKLYSVVTKNVRFQEWCPLSFTGDIR